MTLLELKIQNPNSSFGHMPAREEFIHVPQWPINRPLYPEDRRSRYIHDDVSGSAWNNSN